MKVRLALLLVVLALCCTSVLANDFEAYPFELQDELRAKFVFVGFPGNAAGDTLFEDIHSGIVETIRTYLASHSNGNLTLTDDSGILFKYDEDFGGAEAPLAWEALMPASSYITDAAFDENYEFYDELNGWWIEPETPGHCTQLFAEILWRIYQDYEGNGANPFPAGDGTPWTLFFIFMSESDSSPDGWPGGPWDAGVGGRPSVKVDPVAANASTFGFFANLKQNEAGTRFAGSGQNGWNFLRGYDGTPGGDPVDESFAAEGNARGILHEFVHTMGISDGPPNLHNLPYSEETYYYGYLNLICQHFDGGAGIPPVGDPHLLGIPWNRGRDSNESACYVDITDQNVRGLKIQDVRAGGQMVKIALGPYWDGAGSPPEEYFLLAYHAGTGLDAQDPDGDQTDDPMVPSQGLAIWHCIGGYAGTGTTSFFDLESAMGLWNYGTPNYVPYLIPPTAADMAVNYPNFVADPVNGYDNYDLWRVVPNPTPGEGSHYRAGYGDYWGDEFDFFRSDLSGTVVYYDNNEVPHTIDLADYNNDKFTFVSNPNTYGYSTNATPGVPARRRPQDVPNSIVVHIGEKVSDPYEGDYLTIDYSPGPWGKILVPAESQHLTPGTPIDITWSDEYEPYIDAVDIYYTRDFTTGAWEPLVVGQPIDMVSSWEWTPTVAQATAQRSSSQLRIDFHNTVSDAVATEYSSCFLVDGEDVHAEDIVYPTIGTALYAGATVDLRWTAMYDGEENWSDFRLHWRHEATSDEGYVDLNWSFLPGEGVFRASWTPSELQAWPDVELRMECTNELDEISYGPWSPFLKVYPTGAGFTDKTLDCGVPASNWYSGEPSSSVSMDFDGDDDEDIVISMMEDSQGRGVVAYRNWSSLAGVMALQYVLDTAVFDSPERPQEGATHVASGDLNRDGLRDIVVGMADAVGAKIYKSTGGTPIFDDVTTTYFAPGSLAARENKVYASFVDANHDGYEDVLMASANGGLDQNHFDALFLCRFENQVPQLEESDAWPVFGSGSTVAWADRDQNGYWDVFCGSASGGKILVENSSGGFTDMTNTLPFPIYGVRGACWLDFDHADGLDLAISTTAQGIVVLYGTENPVIPFSGEYLQLDYPEGWQPGGLSAIDYDLNTWADLVLSGASDDATPMLLLNLGDRAEYGERFVDVGTAIGLGLGVSEASNSLAPADYDGDHDIDLMIPRLVDVQVGGENVGGRVYQNQARTGSSAETNWIAFDFESAGSFLGVSSLGTIITLSSEDPVLGQSVSLGRAVLDGGRGFGGQGSGLVVMGLGDFDGTVHFRLHLPNVSVLGTAQPGTIVDVGQMDALQQLSRELDPDLTIEAGSVKRSISVQPDTDLLDWHFTWKTNVWSPKENDIVHLSGSGCAFGSPDLDVNYSDVEVTVTYSFDAETGESTYVHELIWYDQPCLVGCSYSFSVESSTDGPSAITSTASGASGIIKVCPQSY